MNATPKPVTRAAAWMALMTNLFVMPGLGTWVTGQRLAGAIQIALSLLGVLLMVGWACWFVLEWVRREQMPQSTGPYTWVAGAGMALFVFAWLWSIASSVVALRAAPRDAAPILPAAVPPKLD